MRKSFNLIWMVFGFLLLIVGCNEDKKSTALTESTSQVYRVYARFRRHTNQIHC